MEGGLLGDDAGDAVVAVPEVRGDGQRADLPLAHAGDAALVALDDLRDRVIRNLKFFLFFSSCGHLWE